MWMEFTCFQNILLIDANIRPYMLVPLLPAVNINFDKRGPQIDVTLRHISFLEVRPLLGEYATMKCNHWQLFASQSIAEKS